jgi:hypothetical protein
LRNTPHHLGSEPVVAEEDVADSGYQDVVRERYLADLHPSDFQVTTRIRYGADAENGCTDSHHRHDANGYPTHYCHFALPSMSGSTSSGAK